MKKQFVGLSTCLVLFGLNGTAQADLITIGTATYNGSDYKLIYDEGISAVWFDFTNVSTMWSTWSTQNAWAAGLDSQLTYNLDPTWDATHELVWKDAQWRLPATVDGEYKSGYEGDPDGDGIYSYTSGYNLENSEMGHLFYGDDALNNVGVIDTSGNFTGDGNYGLQNTGDFDNLLPDMYWSSTEYGLDTSNAWSFYMDFGYQDVYLKISGINGLAIRSGHVSSSAPIPEPGTMLLFATGLAGLVGISRRKR